MHISVCRFQGQFPLLRLQLSHQQILPSNQQWNTKPLQLILQVQQIMLITQKIYFSFFIYGCTCDLGFTHFFGLYDFDFDWSSLLSHWIMHSFHFLYAFNGIHSSSFIIFQHLYDWLEIQENIKNCNITKRKIFLTYKILLCLTLVNPYIIFSIEF